MTSPTPKGSWPVSGRISRRRALSSAATLGVSLPLLSACSSDAATSDPVAAPDTANGSSTPTPTPTQEAADSGLAATSDIPVGGGVIFTDSRVVVTQPEAGDFKCFSAVCTHSGCLVAQVTSTILCTCHSSSFDISTGEVLGGPAPAPLPAVDFTINNDQVVLS